MERAQNLLGWMVNGYNLLEKFYLEQFLKREPFVVGLYM